MSSIVKAGWVLIPAKYIENGKLTYSEPDAYDLMSSALNRGVGSCQTVEELMEPFEEGDRKLCNRDCFIRYAVCYSNRTFQVFKEKP